MKVELSSQEQKLLVRKLLSLFERDALMEFFKIHMEDVPGGRIIKVEARRCDRLLAAETHHADFREAVLELREQLLAQLPQRPNLSEAQQREEALWPSHL